MQWIWITLGALLLLAAWGITQLLRRRMGESSGRTPRYCRAGVSKAALRRLKKATRLPSSAAEIAFLQDSVRPLMEHLLRLRRQLRMQPALPAGDDGEPRLMALAHDVADDGVFTADTLLDALADWEHTPTPAEVSSLPVCTAAAQCRRLEHVLRAILADAKERAAAARLLPRMIRSKQPASLLHKATLRSIGLAELVRLIRERDPERLLPILEEWLSTHGLTAEILTQQALDRQVQLMEELRRAIETFGALARMDWLSRCAQADSLHPLLLEDPAGVYPRLTPSSQLELRIQAEQFAHRTRLDADAVLRCALSLADGESNDSPGRSVGYWLQDAEGLTRLQRALPTKRGKLYARLVHRPAELRYTLLWCFGLLTGFMFLQSRGPVFMLPFFALVTGCISRWLIRRIPERTPPRIALDNTASDALRTLVVLPAVLTDPHEAIGMVRRIKTLMNALPQEVDFLLLGDFSPAITPVSSGDHAVIHAAASAVAALSDERVMYLQRGRVWDSDRHHYGPRGGSVGAVREICRLIAQGECADVIVFSTVEAARFERAYAYVLAIPSDCQPAPGMYEALLETMAHPQCGRRPSGGGWRGHAVLSPEGNALFDGLGLIRPDAFLEAIDGVASPQTESAQLCGELAGHISIPSAHARRAARPHSPAELYERAKRAWRCLAWQLPLVQTPSGLISNPLTLSGRFRLREELRAVLVPLGQCALLLYAVLTRRWLLMLLALLAPELGKPLRRLQDAMRLVCRISLLPTSMAVPLRTLWDLLRRKQEPIAWSTVEIWAQGIAATVMTALSIALPGGFVPALVLGVLFACFPLTHRLLDAPLANAKGLTDDHLALLDRAASATWRFFQTSLDRADCPLPPASEQVEPPLDAEAVTSPETIGAALLACVCARELDLIPVNSAAQYISRIAAALAELPLPFGLPCRGYSLPSLTITDAASDARSCGFLLCALMTAAQALRTWLPELSPEHNDLSGRLEAIAASFDVHRLYDPSAGLFRLGLDEDGQPTGYAEFFADETLLLSVAACARQIIPPEHFARLRRTQLRAYGEELPLSRWATASAHLLAGLFLPVNEAAAAACIRAMQKQGRDGLFGQDECAFYAFDPALRYQRDVFGLQEAASTRVNVMPVFAPYAAALSLPHLPREAADALTRFDALGALGPQGFCDALDLTQGVSLVTLHDAYHQGLVLIALSHLLADAPIRRYFCSLPQVEACLPLLDPMDEPLLLPALRLRARPDQSASDEEHPADPLHPHQAHVLGTADFRMIVTAAGDSLLYDGDLPLTTRAGDPPFGIQFYLLDEGRGFRIGHPGASSVSFAPGEVRFEQLCGSLRAELVCTVDTVRRRALHIVTLTNLSTRDRQIELADCLLPDLSVPACTLEADQPRSSHLTLHSRGTTLTLHHRCESLVPPLAQSACTDAAAFLGRNCTLHASASLDRPMQDQVEPSATPCLSFRFRFALGGRGQISAWFTTSLTDTDAPALSELTSIRRLAALQHAAIDSAAPVPAQYVHDLHQLVMPAVAAGGRIILQLGQDDPHHLLSELCCLCRRLHMHGMPVSLSVLCTDDVRERISPDLREQVSFVSDEALADGLLLRGDLPLAEQLSALQPPLTSIPAAKASIPALLPRRKLLHGGTYGGFDAETGDYIVELEPGQTTPNPWTNRHISRYFAETADESGLREPFGEQVWLSHSDGTQLSPWSAELPRAARMGLAETTWEAWSDKLDVRLTAACLPGHRCGLRVLRVRNAANSPQTLEITVLARLSADETPLETAPGVVICASHNRPRMSYIAGNGWEGRRIDRAFAAAPPSPDLPDSEHGRLAMLRCTLTLAPHASGKVVWVAGYARYSEDIARALAAIESANPSELLRSVRRRENQRLSALSISTPEDTLDLLVNRILPAQSLSSDDVMSALPLMHLAPAEAARVLLRNARRAQSREDFARLSLLMARYVRFTGNRNLPDVFLPSQNNTLFDSCTASILSLPLDRKGLPLGEDPALRCFLFAAAAKALDDLRPDAALTDFRRKLLWAADTHLWQDGHYGDPLRLDVQCLALLAAGANPRTRQALSRCWDTLYDQPHGLIRTQQPTDAPPLPGLPENGGMRTLDAALCLHALLQTAHQDEAFELLRALNPLHHTDAPHRMDTFRCAPYLLHGGMYAAPMEAGRAVPDGGASAAALLYAVIVEDVLGLKRQGSSIRLTPCVPPEWEEFTLTLREGASTWRISTERQIKVATLDGEVFQGETIPLSDDGKIHRIRRPLT